MYKLTHLKELESESIYVLREVAAQFEKPAILFSGGKDSIVVTYLAYKAFYPSLLNCRRTATIAVPMSTTCASLRPVPSRWLTISLPMASTRGA